MAAPLPQRMTADEYLAAERKAEFKSEFWLGQIYAMAATSAMSFCQNSRLW